MLGVLRQSGSRKAVIQISDNKKEMDRATKEGLLILREGLIKMPSLEVKIMHHHHDRDRVLFKQWTSESLNDDMPYRKIQTQTSSTHISKKTVIFFGQQPEPFSKEMNELVETIRFSRPQAVVCQLAFSSQEKKLHPAQQTEAFTRRTKNFFSALKTKLQTVDTVQSVCIKTPTSQTVHKENLHLPLIRTISSYQTPRVPVQKELVYS